MLEKVIKVGNDIFYNFENIKIDELPEGEISCHGTGQSCRAQRPGWTGLGGGPE